jgi:prepilin-type N-terminal cleavage/methylation domain-containing protein
MRKKLRRGFSLLELIVAFALLAIVSGMLVGFVASSSGAYRTVSTEVGLQYQAQIIQSQVESYIIDCNGGIAFEGDSVYIVNVRDRNRRDDPRVPV